MLNINVSPFSCVMPFSFFLHPSHWFVVLTMVLMINAQPAMRPSTAQLLKVEQLAFAYKLVEVNKMYVHLHLYMPFAPHVLVQSSHSSSI